MLLRPFLKNAYECIDFIKAKTLSFDERRMTELFNEDEFLAKCYDMHLEDKDKVASKQFASMLLQSNLFIQFIDDAFRQE